MVDPDGTRGAAFVDNRDWTEDLTLIAFLRDVGRHVTVNQMVARDSVRARLESEQGLSFTEFSYMLLQARDYLHLHQDAGCELQVGGSDQWGNIVSGVDLVRRVTGHHVHALCWPLLTGADGAKLGKSTGGRVWLDAARTSPYQLFQHYMQVDDADLRRHLLWFTLLPVDEVDALLAAHEERARAPGSPTGAWPARSPPWSTAPTAAAAAEEATDVLFGGDPTAASAAALDVVAREVPVAPAAARRRRRGPAADRPPGRQRAGPLHQRGPPGPRPGRRLRQRASARTDDRALDPDDLLHGATAVLRRGKRAYAVARPGAPGRRCDRRHGLGIWRSGGRCP